MGVALYFIDKLALRAGHEKDEDEADTVGCCTLKVTHHRSFPLKKFYASKLMGYGASAWNKSHSLI